MRSRLRIAVLLACLTYGAGPAAAQEVAARTLLLKGRYAEAAARFSRDVESDPTAAVGLARCRLAVGKWEEAAEILRVAAERFPKAAAIPAELALLALRRGDHDAAKQQAAAALALVYE